MEKEQHTIDGMTFCNSHKLTCSRLPDRRANQDSHSNSTWLLESYPPFSSHQPIMSSNTLPTLVEELPANKQVFDYVIVGGGTAGCVIADRLTENLPNVTVLMIEGGESELGNEEILNLNGASNLWGSDRYDYSYSSIPQPYGTCTSPYPGTTYETDHNAPYVVQETVIFSIPARKCLGGAPVTTALLFLPLLPMTANGGKIWVRWAGLMLRCCA